MLQFGLTFRQNVCLEAESQFRVNGNIYAACDRLLLHRWGGCDYRDFAQFRRETGLEAGGIRVPGEAHAGYVNGYEQAMQLLDMGKSRNCSFCGG